MTRYEIGIVETRNVIKTLLDTYSYDFRDFALTSFKRRLEDVIMKNGLRDSEGLIGRLLNNKDFLEHFLKDITPETTEMFRDPSLWRSLREEIIPAIVKSSSKLKIWVAAFDSGEEIYSLCILLKEMDLLDKFEVFASTISDEVTKKIKSGRLDIKQLEVNEANYERSNGTKRYTDYHTTANSSGTIIIDTSLVDNVKFVKQDTLFSNAPSGMRLVLFRNQLIYFNQLLQDKTLTAVHGSMVPGGYLALGAKETLENTNSSNKFTVVNDAEKIYKKKVG
ncbi:MAG: CheR family methyltransferase [Tenuifilaceae bacterium]|jgi:chemotaxis protein methyltransferase CheR|uniref:CheR family methyltransferase n=1 Tax=Perlabentimonas gracilis TaxID=2715279 RepID=UPI00140B8077|nr:CheR family methyltransferase [Perlabentimonas gracilis]MDX9769956.1 CheR family methyltransferase [Tenuifilaceae bacterium]NHB67604.1 protein-glutamate O-methyltransferase CheR [Perlabentimonas gracilis]